MRGRHVSLIAPSSSYHAFLFRSGTASEKEEERGEEGKRREGKGRERGNDVLRTIGNDPPSVEHLSVSYTISEVREDERVGRMKRVQR